MPLAAHSNLTGLPSLHSLLLSLREKMGDSARPVKPSHCNNHHKNHQYLLDKKIYNLYCTLEK